MRLGRSAEVIAAMWPVFHVQLLVQNDLFMAHVLGGISWTLQSNTTRAYNSSGLVGNTEPSSSNSGSSQTASATSSSPSTKSYVFAAI